MMQTSFAIEVVFKSFAAKVHYILLKNFFNIELTFEFSIADFLSSLTIMQRRTVAVDSSISNQPSEKKQSVNGFNMKLNCMKVFLVLCVLVSAIVYFYLYFRAPDLPFPMSPEMAALYREHGPGEAKQRRRPDINTESDTGEGNEVKNEVNIENKEMGSNMKETENFNVEKSKEATVRQQKMEGETGTKVKKEDVELEKEIIRNDEMKEKPPKYIK